MSSKKQPLTDKEIALQLTIEANKLATKIIEFDRFCDRKNPFKIIKEDYSNFLKLVKEDKQ